MTMQSHHWILLGLVAIGFYLLGAKWPGLAKQAGVA